MLEVVSTHHNNAIPYKNAVVLTSGSKPAGPVLVVMITVRMFSSGLFLSKMLEGKDELQSSPWPSSGAVGFHFFQSQ
jgi:hypothetical protein